MLIQNGAPKKSNFKVACYKIIVGLYITGVFKKRNIYLYCHLVIVSFRCHSREHKYKSFKYTKHLKMQILFHTNQAGACRLARKDVWGTVTLVGTDPFKIYLFGWTTFPLSKVNAAGTVRLKAIFVSRCWTYLTGRNITCEFGRTESTSAVKFRPSGNNALIFPESSSYSRSWLYWGHQPHKSELFPGGSSQYRRGEGGGVRWIFLGWQFTSYIFFWVKRSVT